MKAPALQPKGMLILAILIVVVSISLHGWTWFGRYPLIGRERALAQEIVDLEAEVKRIQNEWPSERESRVEAAYAEAVGTLFSGDPNAATWASQLNEPSNSASLAVGVKPDKPIPPKDEVLAGHLVCMPTTWEFRPKMQGTPLFGEVLRFLRELDADRGRRVEIVDLTMKGNGESVSEARATLRLWFLKEPTPAPDPVPAPSSAPATATAPMVTQAKSAP